ncbi:unnamed protein product [Caenorhabditis bovis]|uniref:Cytochrome P450 n=1 Tax=Caenorhabditis bovis TaxID=2654633 RepID=A0A8S1EJK0_9PELO|nr:unnamed protein product [Caenorhabditis bovis]
MVRAMSLIITDWLRYGLAHVLIMYMYTAFFNTLGNFFPTWIIPVFWIKRIGYGHLVYIIVSNIWRMYYYPPGPPPLPIVGNTLSIKVLTPEQTFLEYRECYGPVFTLHISQPTVILANYESIHEGMITNGNITSGRSSAESFVLFLNDRVNGDGVILAMRQKWKEMRAEITRFMGHLYGSQLDELIMHHSRTLESEIKKVADYNGLVDLREPFSGAIANVIQQITIGKTFLFNDEEFQSQLRDINTVVREIMTGEVFLVNSWPILKKLPECFLRKWTNYKKSGFRLQNWFRTILEDHLINKYQGDFMSYMVERKEDGKQNFSDLSIILVCGDIWTGGMETTVTTLRWGIIYMLLNMDIQKKCHDEVVEVFGHNEPDMRRMQETPYVRAVLSEIQRLANVLPWAIPHKALEECTIGGYRIPVNTEIIPGLGAVLNDPNVFENPEEFNPERFLDEKGCYSPVEQFRPFGLGPRICLGEKIARAELYLIFCSLMQNFEFWLDANDPIPSTERTVGGITAPPKPYVCRVRNYNIRKID